MHRLNDRMQGRTSAKLLSDWYRQAHYQPRLLLRGIVGIGIEYTNNSGNVGAFFERLDFVAEAICTCATRSRFEQF